LARLALPMVHEATKPGQAGAGCELVACANYYSSLFGVLHDDLDSDADSMTLRAFLDSDAHAMTVKDRMAALRLQREEDLDQLAKTIAAERPRWLRIRLAPIAHDDSVSIDFAAALKRHGYAVQHYDTFVNRHLPTGQGGYERYLATLPSLLRNTLARKTRQLEKSGRARVAILANSDQIAHGIEAWTRVYAASWKEAEPHPQFMPGLITMAAAQGWLRLGVVYLDEQPIAAQVWLVVSGVASIYKLAYDQHHARWSAGSVLTAHLMRHVFDIDRVREVDYLTGDDGYKRDWMPQWRQRRGMIAFNLRSWRGLFSAGWHLGSARAKRLLRQWR
ncbi:MAG: GNAT family N-acetyltransferase, partial [Janthinobacterium lividum]